MSLIVETKSGSVYEVDMLRTRVRLLATWGQHPPAPHRYEWRVFTEAEFSVGAQARFLLEDGRTMSTSKVVDVRGLGLQIATAQA